MKFSYLAGDHHPNGNDQGSDEKPKGNHQDDVAVDGIEVNAGEMNLAEVYHMPLV
jgi:hypothetical protein